MADNKGITQGVIEQIATIGDRDGFDRGTEYSRYFGNPWAINIINSYKSIYGRLPTVVELEEATPAFQAPGGHGEAFIAAKYKDEQNTPEKVAERKKKELEEKAPGFYGNVDALFEQSLGRKATDAEKKHFGGMMASGDVDEYTLNTFLQQLPEYRGKQDEDFRKQQRSEFENADTQYYNDTLLPGIQRQFAQQGRAVESSGFASALAQAAKQQAQEREKYLTGLSADQYAGRTAAARDDYSAYMNRMFGDQDYNRSRTNQLYDLNASRRLELENYNIQRASYEEYLRRYGKRASNGLAGGLQGATSGASAGASFGPWGAVIGGVVGGGLGYASDRGR